MNYEERMKAQIEDNLLKDLVKGKVVDITKNEDLFYQVNKDRMTIAEFTNRDKFIQDAKEMKQLKSGLFDPKHGRTKDGKGRLLGEIPAEIYYARKEFSDPMIPREERLKNMKRFLNDFPAFKAGDGRL